MKAIVKLTVRRQISAANCESKADRLKKWTKGWQITSLSVAGLDALWLSMKSKNPPKEDSITKSYGLRKKTYIGLLAFCLDFFTWKINMHHKFAEVLFMQQLLFKTSFQCILVVIWKWMQLDINYLKYLDRYFNNYKIMQ